MSAISQKLTELARKPEQVPAVWKTRRQWQVECGLEGGQMRARLRQLVDAGNAEVRTFRVSSGSGTSHIPHYRIPAMERDSRRAAQRISDPPSNPLVTAC